jgi:hypothetical protein
MKPRKLVLTVLVLLAVGFVYGLFGDGDRAEARRTMLDEVNAACNTSYGCGLCHVDPRGGGALNADGNAYVRSGNDPCYFCASVCNPVPENCTDGIDNDVDGAIDCRDGDCANDPACVTGCTPVREGKGRTCSDGKDNDCDGLVDCADPDCARNRGCR